MPAAFAELGAELVPTPWGTPIVPADRGDQGAGELSFHGALMRTPWDYFLHPEAFLKWVEGLPVPLVNAPAVLRWNHDKRYLRTLGEAEGVELPRTLWLGAKAVSYTHLTLPTIPLV